MNIIERKTIETDVVIDIQCDICGASCCRNKEGDIYEYATLRANWGYLSNKDCECWSVDMCEACADRFAVWVGTQFGKIRKHWCG